jgi:hypothetical protein
VARDLVVGDWPGGRLVADFNGLFGIDYTEIATGGAEPSPLANDGPDAGAYAAGDQVAWRLDSVEAGGTVSADDYGSFSRTGAPDGTYLSDYTRAVVRADGTVVVDSFTITDIIGEAGVTLTVDDLSQAQGLDAAGALSVEAALAIADLLQGQSLDSVVLVAKARLLGVGDLAQAQTLDAVESSASSTLAVADSTQVQALDSVVLQAKARLAVADLLQEQPMEAAGSLTAGDVLSVDDSAQAQVLDGALALQAKVTLAVADLSQAQNLEVVVLSAGDLLGAAGLLQAQQLSAMTLSTRSVLQVSDLSQAQVLEPADLTAGDQVVPADLSQSQALDAVTLRTKSTLTVADLLQAQSLESVAANTGLTLIVADLLQGQATDAVALRVKAVLSVSDTGQVQRLDPVVLTAGSVTLTVAGLVQTQRIDSPAVGNKPRTLAEIMPYVLNDLFDGRVWESATPDELPRNDAGTILPFCVWTTPGGEAYTYVDKTRPSNVHARVQLHVAHPSAIVAERMIWQALDALLASDYTVDVYGSPQGTYDAPRKLRGKMLQISVMFRQ